MRCIAALRCHPVGGCQNRSRVVDQCLRDSATEDPGSVAGAESWRSCFAFPRIPQDRSIILQVVGLLTRAPSISSRSKPFWPVWTWGWIEHMHHSIDNTLSGIRYAAGALRAIRSSYSNIVCVFIAVATWIVSFSPRLSNRFRARHSLRRVWM
jgi:hypothetical protein